MKNKIKVVKDCLYISVGSFILAAAVSFFLVPSAISTGGVSGIATVIYYLFGVPMPAVTLLINLALFAIGYRVLPRESLIKTLLGIVLFSLSLWITDYLASVFHGAVSDISEDIWVSSVFGGALVGVGVGLAVYRNASTGGSDFAALILHRAFPHVSVAVFILMIDAAVIGIFAIVLNDYAIAFYSLVSLYISSKVADFIIVRGDTARTVYVISDSNDLIAERIMRQVKRGVTHIHAYGCYDRRERKMLMCVVRTKEVPRVLEIILLTDESAFTVVSEVKEVRGLGFRDDAERYDSKKSPRNR